MSSGGVFDVDSLRARLGALEEETARPDLWDDREQAEATLREKSSLERDVLVYDRIEAALDDADVLLQLAVEAEDAETRSEVAAKLAESDIELKPLKL